MPDKRNARYAVVFTPVGWQVVDTVEARDPIAQFGLGDDEYQRAKERADHDNAARPGSARMVKQPTGENEHLCSKCERPLTLSGKCVVCNKKELGLGDPGC